MIENEKVISKKDFIAPIISMVAFLLLLGGASYAYFSIGSTSTAQNLSANVNLPARCIAVVSGNKSCTASLTLLQMEPANKGVANNTSVCDPIYVTVNGNKGCTCNFTTTINATNATRFTTSYYINTSVSYVISMADNIAPITNTSYKNAFTLAGETNIAPGWSGAKIEDKTLTVTTTGTAVTRGYRLHFKMRNLNAIQNVMSALAYEVRLQTSTPTCSIPTS